MKSISKKASVFLFSMLISRMRLQQCFSHLLILLIVCAIVFGAFAGERHFWGRHGEARRAEVSREMVVSGNWLIPHLNGEVFITKPPLYYWAAALAFKLTGRFDELSARLPSMLAGTLGVLIVYFWAATAWTPRVGVLSGLILATSFLYGGMARTAGIDMTLTLFTTAALACFSIGYRYREQPFGVQRRQAAWWFMTSAACIGLGTMSKNPIGLAVPLLALVGFVLLTRDVKLLWDAKPWWGALIFFLIVSPWFVLAYHRVPDFLDVLRGETIARYTDPENMPHYEPFYYYIPALGAFAPWVIFLPALVMALITRKIRTISKDYLLVVSAALMTFLLFSSVGSKREYYLLPMYPFLAILVAKLWDDYVVMKQRTARRWTWKTMDIPIVGFGGLLVVIGLALPVAGTWYFSQYVWHGVVFGLLFLAIGFAIWLLFWQRKTVRLFGIFVAGTIVIYLFALSVIVPEMNVYRSRKAFFHEAATLIESHPIADYRYEGFSPQFYLQRTFPVLLTPEELKEFIDGPGQRFILTTSSNYKSLQRQQPQFMQRLKVVLDRTWTSAINPSRQKRLLLLKHES